MQGITGRDDYIIAKALYWALKHAQQIPSEMREESDEDDMLEIASTRYGRFIKGFVDQDESAIDNIKSQVAMGLKMEGHQEAIKSLTPPDLTHFRFIQDGDVPTPPFEFIDEGETKPLAPDHDKNRRELGATIRGTLDAFRESK